MSRADGLPGRRVDDLTEVADILTEDELRLEHQAALNEGQLVAALHFEREMERRACAYGVCPECGKTDGFLNVGRDHWFLCAAHKTKWCVGSNLFSAWREESNKDWQAHARYLESFREVEAER